MENELDFKHGALHGFMTGLFLALPLLGINSLKMKDAVLNNGLNCRKCDFGFVCFTIMGAIME
jgi:hypothetical protein